MTSKLQQFPMDRLDLSDKVVTAWETFPGGPGGTPEENLHLIRMELHILKKLKVQRPSKADKIDSLIGRYQAIAQSLKAKAN